MQTRCPECLTTFRVTPEQLKARAGKVRCGQCQAVFNALDSLVDAPFTHETPAPETTPPAPAVPGTPAPPTLHFLPVAEETVGEPPAAVFVADDPPLHVAAPRAAPTDLRQEPSLPEAPVSAEEAPPPAQEPAAAPDETDTERLSPSQAQELGKATGLILPRETTEIPGYSKWAEGVMTTPLSLPPEKPARWPFVLAAGVLLLALAGQLAYHFRGELAAQLPALRPLLAGISRAAGSDLPLPRHVAQISIETSDLQTDTARGNLLVLNATLRNRAGYAQAFPALELALTDTQDSALVRKVFQPADYLPGGLPPDGRFPATSDVAVRLWLEARDVDAAGYRLYVFYP